MQDNERIRIIIKEIDYWKEHKLLPSVYCDYLLTLYTKGEGIPKDSGKQKADKSPLIYTLNIIFLIFLLPFAFVIIYITQFPPLIKTSVLFIFIVITFIIHRYLKTRSYLLNYLSLIILLLLTLIVTAYIGTIIFNSQLIYQFILLLNFVSWLILSIRKDLTYLLIASSIAILFTLIYMVL